MTEEEIKKLIDDKIAEFTAFGKVKYGDTPTDDLQLVPKKYVDGQYSSIVSSVNGAFVLKGTGTAKGDLIGYSSASVVGRLGVGTDGQFLASQGGTDAPQWQTDTDNLTDNHTWTGFHNFNASTTAKVGIGTSTPPVALGVQGDVLISGSTTVSSLIIASSTLYNGNGTNIAFPSGLGTISPALSYLRNSDVGGTVTTNATTTLGTIKLPANTLSVNSVMEINSWFTVSANRCIFATDFGTGTATNTIAFIPDNSQSVSGILTKLNFTATTQQYAFSLHGYGGATAASYVGFATSSAYSIANPLYIAFTGQSPNSNSTCTLVGNSVTIYGN